MKHSRLVRAGIVLTTAALAVTACTGSAKKRNSATSPAGTGSNSGSGASTPKRGGTVTISNEQGQTWTCNFNPFNPAVYLESVGFVYEPPRRW